MVTKKSSASWSDVKATNIFIGNWRIIEMESWEADYFDREVPAHITIPFSQNIHRC